MKPDRPATQAEINFRSALRKQAAIFLHTKRDWSPQQIADAMGISVITVRGYLSGRLTAEYRVTMSSARGSHIRERNQLIPVDHYFKLHGGFE